jgi:ubiquinone/menaquinone biosynthesis C-methylase UbiE
MPVSTQPHWLNRPMRSSHVAARPQRHDDVRPVAANRERDIYDPAFVKQVFDRCSAGYRSWSQIASFGFVSRWRRQCIDGLPASLPDGAIGLDLMAGTGESWSYLLRRPAVGCITAVDISSEMNIRALDRLHRRRLGKIRLLEADVLTAALPAESADFVISTFGLKTFNRDQQRRFAATLARVLKPGAAFSLIEASDPKGWALYGLYGFYLRCVLPLVEKTVLRGAQDFSMIGTYVENFGDCRFFAECLAAEGLEVEFKRLFFGCATGVVGRKPAQSLQNPSLQSPR